MISKKLEIVTQGGAVQESRFLSTWVIACCLIATLSMAGESSIGIQTEYLEYREPNVMRERGMLAGICGSYSTDIFKKARCRIFASYVMGNMSYQSDSATGLDLSTKTSSSIFNIRNEIGYPLKGICPYAGFGYRFLVDDVPDISKWDGYKREQEYFYIPVGIDIKMGRSVSHSFSARIEYDLFIDGNNKSIGIKMNQDDGYAEKEEQEHTNSQK